MRKAAMGLVLAGALVLGACAEDTLTEEEFASALSEDGGVDADVADCVAEYVYDEIGEDEATDEFASFDGSGDLSEDGQRLLTEATESCAGGATDLGETSDEPDDGTTDPSTIDDGDVGGSTEGPEDEADQSDEPAEQQGDDGTETEDTTATSTADGE